MKSENLTIAIQGIRGSFHHEATRHVFGKNVSLKECHTFKEVINCTSNAQADYGVMAIENSLAGSIIPNYNLLRHSKLEVCGEVGLRIRLNLLALEENVASLTEIQSHPMALRQCTSFLDTLKNSRIIEAFDTAGSAKNILDNNLKGAGAIAGDLAASEYKLNIIVAGIEDHELNYTRFLVLKKKGVAPITIKLNKISIYFETKHSPGSLTQLLSVISGLEINLSKLQSHPIPSKNTHYGFFATLEIKDINQIGHLKILLDSMTVRYQILGVYEKGKTHG